MSRKVGRLGGSNIDVERDVIAALLGELRERQPVVLYLGDLPANDVVRVTRALGAKAVTTLPERADGLPIDVLVLAPGTVRAERRRELERAVVAARHWGVPTLIDAAGAGSGVHRTAAVQRTIQLALWPVIRATDAEAAALTSSARSSKPSQHRRNLSRLASALVRRGGIAVVTGERAVVTDGVRAFTVHNGHRALAVLPGAGYLATAVLGTFLAERAAQRVRNRRSLKAQLLRELAAITPEDLHKTIQAQRA
ncbi:MAG: hydroxyethylthiazole kinase [Armatimonadetes bacterium]|nr:hydroxyethylthiazole kinase [Armatimonadota bacterium]